MVIKSCQQPSPSLVLFLICRCSYQALYSYVPQNDDELELRDGDIVDVMEKCDDGWFVGKNPPFFFPSGVWWDMPKAVLFAQRAISQRLQECWASHSQGSVNVTEWNLKPS